MVEDWTSEMLRKRRRSLFAIENEFMSCYPCMLTIIVSRGECGDVAALLSWVMVRNAGSSVALVHFDANSKCDLEALTPPITKPRESSRNPNKHQDHASLSLNKYNAYPSTANANPQTTIELQGLGLG